MQTADFNFALPPELIAQSPAPSRDQSRLLVLRRATGQIEHRRFPELEEYLVPGDVLVLNDSRVIPARLRGINASSGGAFEILLLEENAPNDWWVMLRPGKRARVGTRILLQDPSGAPAGVEALVIEVNEEGHRRLRFSGSANILLDLDRLGEVPLPPYIERPPHGVTDLDRERYQTTYARPPGSVAAPTAGLHFTKAFLDQVRSRGIKICFVTLHVGLGTFAPVKSATLAGHTMHEERYQLSAETAAQIQQAKLSGRKVVAVGTTTVRVLESAADEKGHIKSAAGRTRIFIFPPYRFKVVDALVTNFHLPRSTLLMLVSAFAAPGEMRGRDLLLTTYAAAIRERYRFFSYGDAMLIL